MFAMYPTLEPNTGLLVRNTDSEAQFTFRIGNELRSAVVALTPELLRLMGGAPFVRSPRKRWAILNLPPASRRPTDTH